MITETMEHVVQKMTQSTKVAAVVSGAGISSPLIEKLELLSPVMTFCAQALGIVIAIILVFTHIKKFKLTSLELKQKELDIENDTKIQ